MGHRAALAAPLLAAALAASPEARAVVPTYVVNSTADAPDANPGDGICETGAGNHDCTLRAAIMEANAHLGANVDVPSGTYALTVPKGTCVSDQACGDLNVTVAIAFRRTGPTPAVVDATGFNDRILSIESIATVTNTGFTFQGSNNANPAIEVASGAELDLTDSRITNCHDTLSGGALYVHGVANLLRVTIDGCSAPGAGGGAIMNSGGELTVTDSTLSGNSAAWGGAIYTLGTSPHTLIEGSTLSDNSATSGGALYMNASSGLTCEIQNATISGNSATQDGGAIYNDFDSTTRLYNTTITNNQADSDFNGTGTGGGVYSVNGATFSFANTVLAGNWDSVLFLGQFYISHPEDCIGSVTSAGYNVIRNYNTQACFISGAFTLADPMLDTLRDNGGRTMTHLPLAGSPAIGGGDPTGCRGRGAVLLTADQRGVTRPIGPACELGAYELEPKGDVNGDGVVNVADVFYLINYLFAAGPVPLGRANVNGDGVVSVADVLYLINFLFAGGPAPI